MVLRDWSGPEDWSVLPGAGVLHQRLECATRESVPPWIGVYCLGLGVLPGIRVCCHSLGYAARGQGMLPGTEVFCQGLEYTVLHWGMLSGMDCF